MLPSPHPCGSSPPLGPGAEPVAFDPAWRTDTVLGLARAIRELSAFDRMPILADALEEAGCDQPAILAHCRECREHVTRCWVVSQVLLDPAPAVVETAELPLTFPVSEPHTLRTVATGAARVTGCSLLVAVVMVACLGIGAGIGYLVDAWPPLCLVIVAVPVVLLVAAWWVGSQGRRTV